MNNGLKRCAAVVFTLMFLFSVLSLNVLASVSKELISSDKTIVNEWDEYIRITSMSDKELAKLGYSESEIIEIRKFDYEKEIRNRARLDDDTLKKCGYTDKDIVELRQAAAMKTIPEEVMRDISKSTMTSELRYIGNGYRQEAGSTMYYINLKFSWNWSRVPIFKLVDMVAVGYNSNNNYYTYCVQSNLKVRADLLSVNPSYSDIVQTENWVYSTSKANSISAKLAVALTDEDGALTHFARSGYGTFQLTSRSNQVRLYVDACYGHTTINIVPSYSVSTSDSSVGLNFIPGVDEQHCTGWFYEDYTISTSYIYHGVVWGKNSTGGEAP